MTTLQRIERLLAVPHRLPRRGEGVVWALLALVLVVGLTGHHTPGHVVGEVVLFGLPAAVGRRLSPGRARSGLFLVSMCLAAAGLVHFLGESH